MLRVLLAQYWRDGVGHRPASPPPLIDQYEAHLAERGSVARYIGLVFAVECLPLLARLVDAASRRAGWPEEMEASAFLILDALERA